MVVVDWMNDGGDKDNITDDDDDDDVSDCCM